MILIQTLIMGELEWLHNYYSSIPQKGNITKDKEICNNVKTSIHRNEMAILKVCDLNNSTPKYMSKTKETKEETNMQLLLDIITFFSE